MSELDCEKHLAELHARADVSLAAALCESPRCAGKVLCQRYLGWVYFNRGEPEKAADWYLKAATQGNSEAIEECWKCIVMIDAKGGKETAMRLCETMPLSEYLDCQRYLTKAYFEKGDTDSLLHWCLKAADHGRPDDLLYVGRLYLSRQQPLLAVAFLKRAAAGDNYRAHQLLGEIYAYGLGMPKDVDVATRHYEMSAAKGFILSQVRLLHLRRRQGGVMSQLIFLARLPVLLLKTLIIKSRNPNDSRLADIPARVNH